MTKREAAILAKSLERLTVRVGKKRDELRALLDEFDQLLDTVRDGVESLDGAKQALREARQHVDYAAEQMSQYA